MIDPEHLEDGALAVLAALLQSRLDALAADADATPELTALAHHLLPALGLSGGLPPLPLDRIGEDADLLRVWLAELLDTAVEGRGQAIAVWLEHVGGLFGAGAPAGAGTQDDPWAIRLAALGTGGVDLTFATRTATGGARELLLGVRLALDSSIVSAQAAATLLALPLSGTAGPIVLPSATVDVRAPRDASERLVEGPPVRLGSARVGAAWDGRTLRPLIELRDVQVEGIDYPVIDLSNVDSATAAIATAIREAIEDALGDQPPGRNLAALAGLVAPAANPASPLIDPAALIADPAREIARVHRTILTGGAQGWAPMLGELAGLLGSTGVGGGGSEDDPWRSELAAAGPLSVQLAAWTGPGDPVRLHIGLRAGAAFSPLSGSWLAELIAVGLPADAPASIELMGGQHGRLALAGPLSLAPADGLELEIGSAEGRFDWEPGGRLAPVLRIAGITLVADPDRAELPQFVLPADGFDPTLPDLGLGVAVADLVAAVRILLSRLAASWGGAPGFTLAGLLGLHARLPGLPADWPLLGPPPGAGVDRLLADPLGPLRTWVGRIATELSADGTPFATHALGWLRSWLQGTLPALDAPDFGAPDLDARRCRDVRRPVAAGAERRGPHRAADVARAGGAAGVVGERRRCRGGRARGAARRRGAAAGLRAGAARHVRGPGAGTPRRRARHRRQRDRGGRRGRRARRAAAGRPRLEPRGHARRRAAPPAAGPPGRHPAGPRTARRLAAGRRTRRPVRRTAVRRRARVGRAAGRRRARRPPGAPLPARTSTCGPHPNPPWRASARSLPRPPTTPPTWPTPAASSTRSPRRSPPPSRGSGICAAVVPVILVAHSTAGLAAHAFAATNPTLVAGLITLGTPHGGAPLSAVAAPDAAEALRAARLVLQSAGEQGSLADAVAHLSHLLDGWQPGPGGSPRSRCATRSSASRGQTARTRAPAAFPRSRSAASSARARWNAWRMRLRRSPTAPRARLLRRTSRSAYAGSSTSRPRSPAASTWMPGSASTRSASGSRPAPRSRRGPRIASTSTPRISRPGDWLLATPSARLRRAELGLTVERSADGLVATPRARFYDAAISAPTAPLVELADPMAEELLDAAIGAATSAGESAGARSSRARSTPSGFSCTTTRGPRASRPRPWARCVPTPMPSSPPGSSPRSTRPAGCSGCAARRAGRGGLPCPGRRSSSRWRPPPGASRCAAPAGSTSEPGCDSTGRSTPGCPP